MKSIKPGRGPSMMGGFVGIFMIGFGIFWTVMAAQASMAFALFGVCWTGMAIATTIYNFKNATSRNRYSVYDITDEFEESDPFNERFRNESIDSYSDYSDESRFCPYCGKKVERDYEFCDGCGKKLP